MTGCLIVLASGGSAGQLPLDPGERALNQPSPHPSYKNSIRDARTPQPGEKVFGTRSLRQGQRTNQGHTMTLHTYNL